MSRVRSKRFVLQAVVTIPVAALLLSGCGGGESDAETAPATSQTSQASTPAEDTIATPEGDPSAEISATPQSMDEMLENLLVQLEVAAKQAGPEKVGALTCETIGGFLTTAKESKDETAVAKALGKILDSIVKGASDGGKKVEGADLDTATKKECSDQREQVLKISGADSLESLTQG
jgi:hypothetical protein